MAYTLIHSEDGDWVGLYSPDGVLLAEGHSLAPWQIFRAVAIELVEVERDFGDWGRCPERIEDW